jgi:peptidylprolyl isomerase
MFFFRKRKRKTETVKDTRTEAQKRIELEDSDANAFWAPHDKNPRCFLDISVDGKHEGRIKIKLLQNIVPKTCENFRALCTGEKGLGARGKVLHYKNTYLHTVIPGFYCQGGDFVEGNGVGGASIYGEIFDDENFELGHSRRGVLSMANKGPNTNGSQFIITLAETSWLDKKHVVFGEIVSGMKILRKLEGYGTENGITTKVIKITNSGQLSKPILNPMDFKKYHKEIFDAKQIALKASKQNFTKAGYPKNQKVKVWVSQKELGKKATEGGMIEAKVTGYSVNNVDSEKPKEFVHMIIIKLTKGKPSRRELELHELQQQMLGPPPEPEADEDTSSEDSSSESDISDSDSSSSDSSDS